MDTNSLCPSEKLCAHRPRLRLPSLFGHAMITSDFRRLAAGSCAGSGERVFCWGGRGVELGKGQVIQVVLGASGRVLNTLRCTGVSRIHGSGTSPVCFAEHGPLRPMIQGSCNQPYRCQPYHGDQELNHSIPSSGGCTRRRNLEHGSHASRSCSPPNQGIDPPATWKSYEKLHSSATKFVNLKTHLRQRRTSCRTYRRS